MKKYHLRLNGKKVSSNEFHRRGPVGGDGAPMTADTYSEAKPLISEGLGCMKSQVPEMREMLHYRGIRGVSVLESGQLKITSRRGRKELCRVRGLADGDGGFSD